jgi:hypothetical protein
MAGTGGGVRRGIKPSHISRSKELTSAATRGLNRPPRTSLNSKAPRMLSRQNLCGTQYHHRGFIRGIPCRLAAAATMLALDSTGVGAEVVDGSMVARACDPHSEVVNRHSHTAWCAWVIAALIAATVSTMAPSPAPTHFAVPDPEVR